jgi:hypothetical protein
METARKFDDPDAIGHVAIRLLDRGKNQHEIRFCREI